MSDMYSPDALQRCANLQFSYFNYFDLANQYAHLVAVQQQILYRPATNTNYDPVTLNESRKIECCLYPTNSDDISTEIVFVIRDRIFITAKMIRNKTKLAEPTIIFSNPNVVSLHGFMSFRYKTNEIQFP